MTGEKVYVPRGGHEKQLQRALLQYRRPENRELVEEALHKAGRDDLIGYGEKCLIRPAHKNVKPSSGRPERGGGTMHVHSGGGRGNERKPRKSFR